jgi:hypothetical protein
MFAGQTVTFIPRVSKGVGGEEKLLSIILLGKTYNSADVSSQRMRGKRSHIYTHQIFVSNSMQN